MPELEAPSTDFERRLVVFTDGPSPRIVSSGERDVRGPLELEVRFRSVSPLCYEYSTNVSASRVAATDLSVRTRLPGIGAFGAPGATAFPGLEEAILAVNNAQSEIDEVMNAARIYVSLDDVWADCDGSGDSAAQRARVESAALAAAERLGPAGTWRRVLENAEAGALGAKRMSRDLEAGEHEATQEVEARKGALVETEKKERDLRDAAARSGRTRKLEDALDDSARDIAGAQRKLREAELRLNRNRRAGELGRAAERLGERVQKSLDALAADVAEINRARSLLARSPTAIRRRFGPGEKIRVVVKRTRLDRGERVADRAPQLFEVPSYQTLRPVILDLGIGPALGVGHDTEKYETVWTPASRYDTDAEWRVVRTEQGLPLDAMVSIGAYVWERRYFDDTVVAPMQFLPRPMIGVSLAHPLSVLYAGVQVDPVKFLDVSFGARFANEDHLVGPQPLDRALIDDAGEPQPPVTRKQIRASGFVALTVSTNLIYGWLRQAP